MKKLICLLLSLVLVLGLFACSGNGSEGNGSEGNGEGTGNEGGNKTPAADYTATEEEKAALEKLYEGLQVHHGQLHDHSQSGRRSDGKATLQEWKDNMPSVGMEYAALLDHRQTDHMYHEDWSHELFISGTEAMTYISDRDAKYNKYHYNMIFNDVKDMEAVLSNHMRTYMFVDGVFDYNPMSSTEFTQIIQEVLASGGYFVIPHPYTTAIDSAPEGHEGYWYSEDPLEYYFCDGIGYEVFYHISDNEKARDELTALHYELYTGLLAAGKKVYASAGSDVHGLPTDRGLSTVYSSQKLDTAYIEQLRKGNYTAGPVGVRMSIGETTMGGTGDFNGKRIVVSVGDFHKNYAGGKYQLKLFSDKGEVATVDLASTDTAYFAFDADESAKFYRVEIHDTTREYTLLAMGNPIWND